MNGIIAQRLGDYVTAWSATDMIWKHSDVPVILFFFFSPVHFPGVSW